MQRHQKIVIFYELISLFAVVRAQHNLPARSIPIDEPAVLQSGTGGSVPSGAPVLGGAVAPTAAPMQSQQRTYQQPTKVAIPQQGQQGVTPKTPQQTKVLPQQQSGATQQQRQTAAPAGHQAVQNVTPITTATKQPTPNVRAQPIVPAALATAAYIQRYPAGTIVFLQTNRGYAQPVNPPVPPQIGIEVCARAQGAGGPQAAWWQLLKSVNPNTNALLLGFKSLAAGSLAFGNDMRADPTSFAVLCDKAMFTDPVNGGGAQWELVTTGGTWLRNPTSGAGYLNTWDPSTTLWTCDKTKAPATNDAYAAIQIMPVPNQITTAAAYTAPGLFGSYNTWWKLPTAGSGRITFTVAAQSDIRIGISATASMAAQMYDIDFGGNGNTATYIRQSFRGTNGNFQGNDAFTADVKIPKPNAPCTLTLTVNQTDKTITITGGSAPLRFLDRTFLSGLQYVSLSSEQAALAYTGIHVQLLKSTSTQVRPLKNAGAHIQPLKK